ncbi:Bacterial membrane protein YfhO [Aquisphaera giovannonii]|uniref:Bacterial membrane protein YfhO n=1 Tax=Aquisphaera giovannonii TaxID=406548 RepID=A0A5B9WAA1_9BACT|nr:YfhO family protein [Aquisphaera giovannonii]QEH36790.1 Bacterial membrane protein YfhO [Aquisphaera giovannonii]
MADAATATEPADPWFRESPWGWSDLAALAIWSAAVAWLFWDAVILRGALFYFDITEINYPYRAFFAEELRAGRFSRWCPWLYCGMPLYSESQAGYLHPFKYLLYPWMETWKAFNLDTILSVWLTGAATFGWLRRHVAPAAALTGAALFGIGGFTWAHLVHTSMINALASVPILIWALEWSWDRGHWRGVVVGAAAMACQVFAGHLQDVLLTAGIVGCYGAYRGITSGPGRSRWREPAMAAALLVLGVLLSAIQWIPSKELLDRSPRAGGLTYEDLTYASWSPELLPTLLIREAYGTRARDTDWMDGFYPYHEMDAYLGALGLALALVGIGGAGREDRWTGFWSLLAILGGLLMLGRFTFLFDYANRIPVLGSSREPVRFHLWFSLAVAAMAAVGVERLSRPGAVRLAGAAKLLACLAVASGLILAYNYAPVWTQPRRWTQPYHLDRYRWLGREFGWAAGRNLAIVTAGLVAAARAASSSNASLRGRLAWALPVLVLVDLASAHARDVPTVDPAYWTKPPASVEALRADPGFIRVFGDGDKHSGEPGYASEPIDFLPVRDPLDWSLAAAWGLRGDKGETPMKSKRLLDYFDAVNHPGCGRFDIESVSHMVVGRGLQAGFRPNRPVGAAFVHRNPGALPRARLLGRPVYVRDAAEGVAVLETQGKDNLHRLVVEDPTRPLPEAAEVAGKAAIVEDLPERMTVETDSAGPSYLLVADTFDPGWSATVDGVPAEIRPGYVAFRAVYLAAGPHRILFTYRPAGFLLGSAISAVGLLASAVLLFLRAAKPAPGQEHAIVRGLPRARGMALACAFAIVLLSAFTISEGLRPAVHGRWRNAFHRFTWGSGIEAMKEHRQ